MKSNFNDNYMKIVFEPISSYSNKYVNILVNLLKEQHVTIYPLNVMLKSIAIFRQVQIVHFNWYENLQGRFIVSIYYRFLRKVLTLYLLSICGKKIVWTMHNRMPHDIKMVNLKRKMMRFMVKRSNAIVIHSKVTEEILLKSFNCNKSKIYHIPHPNYIDSYPNESISFQNSIAKAKRPLRLLFIGAVKPYKNIELLLDVVKRFDCDDIELLIAGKPSTNDYGNILKECSAGFANIKLELDFISDQELPSYIGSADILILPYDLRSSLNSGTVMLAFSLGRTVICPQIGTIDDLDTLEYIYTYDYASIEEHHEKLFSSISLALVQHSYKKDILLEKGQKMKELVAVYNSNDNIVEQLKYVYNTLLVN